MSKISFCIASAKNEKEYTKLLIRSLVDNTDIKNHEILVFLDTDNQNTYESLLELKTKITNLKIYRNTEPYQIGGQRNISLMFDAASNDIVCYLQSDMVAGPNFDKYIIENMIDKNIVLTCTRIEPPLHPASPEKIQENFGLNPEEFQYDNFNQFVIALQNSNRPNTEGHFAPFCIHKSVWLNTLGGFDTQFRCSREDSDMIIRMNLAGLNLVQTWHSYVYHFTCVSSRGVDWYKKDKTVEQQNILQQLADNEELKKFIRKWGLFGHHAKPVYDIGFFINVDQFVDFNLLHWLEIYCKVLYLNNKDVAEELSRRTIFNAEYYTNLRWNYPSEHWQSINHLFNQKDFLQHIKYAPMPSNTHDVNIYVNYSTLIDNFDKNRQAFMQNINDFIHSSDIGEHTVGPLTINISKKNNLMNDYIKNKDIIQLLDSKKFVFE
jgi:GT2 family glycosyltransferase